MSPSLINIYVDAMMKKVAEVSSGGVLVGIDRVVIFDFVVDGVLLADS